MESTFGKYPSKTIKDTVSQYEKTRKRGINTLEAITKKQIKKMMIIRL